MLAQGPVNILTILVALTLAIFPHFSSPCPASAADEWTVMSSGTSENLSSVWGSSSNDVFAIGEGGTILHYDGSSWSAMSSGTSVTLYGVWGNSGRDVYAVGEDGTLLHYNGSSWGAMTSGTTVTLYGVWGSSISDVYAVGDGGTILHYDGSSWSAMTSGTSNALKKAWGTSSLNVFAVGEGGTILNYNGSIWAPMDSDTTMDINSIWGSSPDDIWAVGIALTVLHYSGGTWTRVFPHPLMVTGNDIWGTSANHIFSAWVNVMGQAGHVKYYDGNQWTTPVTPSSGPLNGVWGSCSNDVFVVGDLGTILHFGSGSCSRVVISANAGTGGSISPGGQVTVNIGSSPVFTITADNGYLIDGVFVDGVAVGAVPSYTFSNVRTGHTINAVFRVTPVLLGTGSHSSTMVSPPVLQDPTPLPNIGVTGASLSEARVLPGAPVTVTVIVVNTGTGNGTAVVKVYVDGQEETSRGIMVNSGVASTLTFDIYRNSPGTYAVNVGGRQAGSFTVEQSVNSNIILYISGALLIFALAIGLFYILRRR